MSAEKRTVKKKKRWGKIYEYTPVKRDVVLNDETAKEIEKDLKKTPAVTPSSLAIKHGIRVSLAKKILKDYEEKGNLTSVFSKSRYKIFKS